MPTRRAITILLLAWTLALGFIEAGVQPVYGLDMEKVPACSSGCERPEERSPENCLAVCMVWGALPAFSAVSEGEPVALGPVEAARTLDFENFEGQIRPLRPLLPPPRV